MDIIKRRQHYVPKTYLRQFSTSGKSNDMVCAYFVKQKTMRFVSIDDVCVESYLYEHYICYDNGETDFIFPNSIENKYMKYENAYRKIIEKIISNPNDIVSLAKEERSELTEFMASVLFRHPIFINNTNDLCERIYSADSELREDLSSKFPEIEDIYFKMIYLHMLLERFQDPKQCSMIRAMKRTFDEDQLCVFKSTSGEFITSDAPIVNVYGDIDGIQYDLVGMPISPEYFVAFIDTDRDVSNKVFVMENEQVKRLNSYQYNRPASSVVISKDMNTLRRQCIAIFEKSN